MTLINDDVAEVVLGIVRRQEIRRTLLTIHVEGLVRGHVHACVSRVVRAVGLAVDLGGIGSEDILQDSKRLAPQFVTVADEKCPPELADIGEPLEEVDRESGALIVAMPDGRAVSYTTSYSIVWKDLATATTDMLTYWRRDNASEVTPAKPAKPPKRKRAA